MITEVDYNRRGPLLEELAEMSDSSKRSARLFEVILDIRDIVEGLYTNLQDVSKLEDELDSGLDQQELRIISEGVQIGLRRGLDQNPYGRDAVNQVFIALYENLIQELESRTLDEVVDYSRGGNMNGDIVKVVKQLNIYNVFSSWVNYNTRSIENLDEDGMSAATNQFRELKKSSRGFVRGFRRLLRRSNNVDSAYKQFSENNNWETYNDMISVVKSTIKDCGKILQDSISQLDDNGMSIMRRFAEVIMLNAEYISLNMGYEILHNEVAKKTMPDPEGFRSQLVRTASIPGNNIYLMMPDDKITEIDSSIKKLIPERREFYLGPK